MISHDCSSFSEMDVSRFYRNTDFSEQTLVLYNERDEKKDMYPVHHIVWSAASTYFDSLFVRWDNSDREMSYHVQEEYVDAFDVIVKFFYTNTVSIEDLSMLYRVLVLSDKLDCTLSHRCVELLGRIPQQGFDVEDLCLFYDAPPGITENVVFMNAISTLLMREVGDFQRVLNDETLLKKFMRMSPEALKCLLSRNDLRTDGEDTIFLVVHLWVTEGRGMDQSVEFLKGIGEMISLIDLSESFLDQFVPSLDWMDLNASKLLFYRRLKKFKNLAKELVTNCEVEIDNSDKFVLTSKQRVLCTKGYNGVFIEVNMPRFVQWINGDRTEPFDTPFVFRKDCIVFSGTISVSPFTVDLRFDVPRVFRTSIPMIHIFDGFLSMRITKGGLMSISEKFYLAGMCKCCLSYKCMYDMIPMNDLSLADKMSFYLRIN